MNAEGLPRGLFPAGIFSLCRGYFLVLFSLKKLLNEKEGDDRRRLQCNGRINESPE